MCHRLERVKNVGHNDHHRVAHRSSLHIFIWCTERCISTMCTQWFVDGYVYLEFSVICLFFLAPEAPFVIFSICTLWFRFSCDFMVDFLGVYKQVDMVRRPQKWKRREWRNLCAPQRKSVWRSTRCAERGSAGSTRSFRTVYGREVCSSFSFIPLFCVPFCVFLCLVYHLFVSFEFCVERRRRSSFVCVFCPVFYRAISCVFMLFDNFMRDSLALMRGSTSANNRI